MSKDPAFLFYSQNFYESTRMMLPEERACYLDLLIYQHQNGKIPLDTSRLHLYCTGVVNEVVNQVLNQRFKKTEDGWYNKKLDEVMQSRKNGNPKKIAYSTLAGLLSANSISEKDALKIKKEFNVDDYLELSRDEIKKKIKTWFYDVVNGFVNNKINRNRDINRNKNIDKDILEKYEKPFEEYPTFEDFWNAYDKKTGKPNCEKKWSKLSKIEKNEIMEYIPRYKISQPDKQYRKNPETFLNNKSWNDELITSKIENRINGQPKPTFDKSSRPNR